MKTIISLILISLTQIAIGQDEKLGFEAIIDSAKNSYIIYRKVEGANAKRRFRKVVFSNAKLTKIESFSNDGNIYSTENLFYRNDLLIKSALKYYDIKSVITTEYFYVAGTNSISKERVIKDGKIVQEKNCKYQSDSIIINTFFNGQGRKNPEQQIIIPNSTHDKKNTRGLVIETVDSVGERLKVTTFFYDDFDRLICSLTRLDGKIFSKQNILYGEKEIEKNIFTFFNANDSLLIAKDIKRFDDSGKLIYNEILDYTNTKDNDPLRLEKGYFEKRFFNSNGLERVNIYREGRLYEQFFISYL